MKLAGYGRKGYACYTKNLQRQVLRDFPFALYVVGKENYMCPKIGRKFRYELAECRNCIYFCDWKKVKAMFETRDWIVTNFAYLFSNIIFTKKRYRFGIFTFDEADVLHNALINALTVKLPRTMRKYGDLSTIDGIIDACKEGLYRMKYDKSTKEVLKEAIPKLKLLKYIERYVKIYNDNYVTVVKPIFPKVRVWTKHINKTLFMSATIDKEYLNKEFGFKEDELYYIEMKSNISPDRRPVYYFPLSRMDYSKQKDYVNSLAKFFAHIAGKHKKVIVHTVSKEMANEIFSKFIKYAKGRKLFLAYGKRRDNIIEKFVASEEGILVSPSIERGFDDESVTCNIILKLPREPIDGIGFERMTWERDYYELSALRRVMQMAGRACRSPTDFGETYIFDTRFFRNFKKYYMKLPEWFKEAVKPMNLDLYIEAMNMGVVNEDA